MITSIVTFLSTRFVTVFVTTIFTVQPPSGGGEGDDIRR